MSPKLVKRSAKNAVAVKKKRTNGYKMPDPIPNGEVLKDKFKKEWKLGQSIGVGGFGEIYCASEVMASTNKGSNSYPYVIKIEPRENGPLFVEMHFYLKVGKSDEIMEWIKTNRLKSLGMPQYLGSGSHDCNGKSYRFLVMDRYGKDLWSIFLENNRVFPYATVLRLGLQIIDILQYIHSKMYVHADIKGSNLLLGLKRGTENQVFLVDFGLASRCSKEYKLDPKKAHNGTLEYTSRDAHLGISTKRGDLEILGYNLLQWLSSKLPWENMSSEVQVQEQKIKYMNNIPDLMKKCFMKKQPPNAIIKYFENVASLKELEEPNYEYLRNILEKDLKEHKFSMDGKLNFSDNDSKMKANRLGTKKSENSIDLEAVTYNANSMGEKKIAAKRAPRKQLGSKQNLNTNDSLESERDNETAAANNRVKPRNTKDKVKLSWRDCPTVIACAGYMPGVNKRPSDEMKTSFKKQKK